MSRGVHGGKIFISAVKKTIESIDTAKYLSVDLQI